MRLTNASTTAEPQAGRAHIGENEQASRPSHWRPDIEGLRAVAVVAVIAAHIGLAHAEGGFVGVDVFFVISGFLITSLLLREIDRTGTVSVTGFYARRAVRLLPAAAVVVAATIAAAWMWLPRTRLHDIATDAAAAALNVVNLRLASEGTDYLNATADPSPLQHFWSLAVEEQFYIAWPLLLLGTAILARRVWGGRFARKGHLRRRRHTTVAAALVVIAAVSFSLSATLSASDPVWSYFGTHTRAWELAVGAGVALAANRLRRLPAALACAASWTGLGLIVAAILLFGDDTAFPGTAALVPVAGAALVIAAGCAPHRFGATTVLRVRPAQYLGKTSYGLYLWHWPLVVIGPAVLGVDEPSIWDYLLLMAVAFLLAVATFHLVENPIRTRRPLVQVPSRALAMGGALISAALSVSILASLQPMPSEDNDEAEEVDGDETTVWELLDQSSDVDIVPANLTPSLDEAQLDEPVLYDDGCQVEREVTEVRDDCWYGDPDGEKTIVLFGDSHAAQWFPALNQLAEASGWKLLVEAKSNCSVPDVVEEDYQLDRRYTECEEWKEGVFDLLEEIQPDVVVASAYDRKEIVADDPDRAWVDGWVESLDRLDEVADKVYYMADTADPPGDAIECLSEHPNDASECVGTVEESIVDSDRRDAVVDAVSEETDAEVVDPLPWICDMDDGTCPVIVGNLLVYRDSNHLAARFVAELAPQVSTRITLEDTRTEES